MSHLEGRAWSNPNGTILMAHRYSLWPSPGHGSGRARMRRRLFDTHFHHVLAAGSLSAMRWPVLGKLGPAVFYLVVMPGLLAAWAFRLDHVVGLPAYGSPILGVGIALVGLGFILASVWAFWNYGNGIPMSLNPPSRFVSRGIYRYLRDPMYLGTVLVVVGASLFFRSAAGLWIVSPGVALMAAAWVLGYERDETHALYGSAYRAPRLALPVRTVGKPGLWDRLSVYFLLLLPWLILFEAVELLGVPHDAIDGATRLDRAIPVVPWTAAFYVLTYPFVFAVPLIGSRRKHLWWFMTRGWIATLLIIPFYLLFPIVFAAKPVEGGGILGALLRMQHAFDQPVTAFPAFHLVWVLLAARVYGVRWRELRGLWMAFAVLVAFSCVLTGMHGVIDVVAGVAAYMFVSRIEFIWRWVRRETEQIANSWHQVTVGPLWLVNHGLYAAAGTWIGLCVAVMLAGSSRTGMVVLVAVVALVSAMIPGLVVERSFRRSRSFNTFSATAGGMLALLVADQLGAPFWHLLSAGLIGACFAQAIGKIRCLVRGCCHGSECPEWLGIRYTHPRSRVARISGLGNRPLHPTQLYAMLWLLFVGAILLRLWAIDASLQFIAGSYFMLVGLGRFVEEHFRGEPDERVVVGLRHYQLHALAFIGIGAILTVLGNTHVSGLSIPSAGAFAAITTFSVLVYFVFAADVSKRHTRLLQSV